MHFLSSEPDEISLAEYFSDVHFFFLLELESSEIHSSTNEISSLFTVDFF